jgi:hypothetical protein
MLVFADLTVELKVDLLTSELIEAITKFLVIFNQEPIFSENQSTFLFFL